MTTLAKHFDKLTRLVRLQEDEIHKIQEHNHIVKDNELAFLVNLSDEVHAVRQGIERTKLLLGVENGK